MAASSPDIMFEFCAERRRKCLKDEGRMGNVDFLFMLGILGLKQNQGSH